MKRTAPVLDPTSSARLPARALTAQFPGRVVR